MKKTHHIVVDSNKSHRIPPLLEEAWRLIYPSWTVRHEQDVMSPSTDDRHWIARLREIEREGEWIILTSDKGANSKVTDKLPLIAKQFDHSFIIIHHNLERTEDVFAAIVGVAHQFDEVIEACRKLVRKKRPHIRLSREITKSGDTHYRLQLDGRSLSSYFKTKASRRSKQKTSGNSVSSSPAIQPSAAP